MRVHIGSDHAGFELKNHLVGWLTEHGHDAIDHGPHAYDDQDDYPPFCLRTAESVVAEPGSLGIVIGGSGNGEQIAANKVKGVRAALAWSDETAQLARLHNDANVSRSARACTPSTRRPVSSRSSCPPTSPARSGTSAGSPCSPTTRTPGSCPPLPDAAPARTGLAWPAPARPGRSGEASSVEGLLAPSPRPAPVPGPSRRTRGWSRRVRASRSFGLRSLIDTGHRVRASRGIRRLPASPSFRLLARSGALPSRLRARARLSGPACLRSQARLPGPVYCPPVRGRPAAGSGSGMAAVAGGLCAGSSEAAGFAISAGSPASSGPAGSGPPPVAAAR